MSTFSKNSKFIPLTEWEAAFGWPTTAALRHYTFYEEKNGFSNVIRRVGRRILIDVEAFDEWVDNNGSWKRSS